MEAIGPQVFQERGVDREVLVVLLGEPHIQHPLGRLDPVHLGGNPGSTPGDPQPGPEDPTQDRPQRCPVDIGPSLKPVPALLVNHGVRPYLPSDTRRMLGVG